MTDSLRDQLLGLGFKPAPKPEPRPAPRPQHRVERPGEGRPARAGERGQARQGQPRQGQPRQGHPRHGQGAQQNTTPMPAGRDPTARPIGGNAGRPKPQRSREEMDLGKAYAIRAQREKEDRVEAERLKQEQGRLRREAKAAVEVLLKDRTLNHPDADIARHFNYGGKIKRVHVTSDQLKALNAGELGVVQQNGRYLLVPVELLAQAEALFPQCVALKVDPDAPAEADPYVDPRFQVPDDLVW